MTEKALIFPWGPFVGVESHAYVIVCRRGRGDCPRKTKGTRRPCFLASEMNFVFVGPDTRCFIKIKSITFLIHSPPLGSVYPPKSPQTSNNNNKKSSFP